MEVRVMHVELNSRTLDGLTLKFGVVTSIQEKMQYLYERRQRQHWKDSKNK